MKKGDALTSPQSLLKDTQNIPVKPSFSLKDLQNDLHQNQLKIIEGKHSKAKPENSKQILERLLQTILIIDFRQTANLDEDAKIFKKTYVTIVVDEVLKSAINNQWGICTKDGFIYIYNGRYWQVTEECIFKDFLAQAAIRMGVPDLEARYHLFKDELYRQFLSESYLSSPEQTDQVLINLQNGTFEISLQKQKVRLFDSEDFLKHILPFEYNPQTTCPVFSKYLNQVLPDKTTQQVLAEYIGYVFLPHLKLEKAAILYGNGANGKSVFFDIINALLGKENICSYSLESLTKSDSYERAELSNKLLNYASEINGKLESSIFKQLVSGEAVQARRIYSTPFVMDRYAKLMFNCNELPREVELTNAFFRRFIIIPFNQTISESEQDPELAKKIINTELSGIFNWVLDGLERLLTNKRFTESTLVKEQIDRYRREADSVAMFIEEEQYKPSLESEILLKTIYSEYRQFCQENGYKACSTKKLAERLRSLGFIQERKSQGNIIGIKK